uniref:Uncharacterized protein n=1 Tax=Rhizophagus irregularis (strain DAOM 181602 / DAOM 197198 / MUCL 43194) TaxID=747089 RepID=U9TQK8_RHIID
MEPYYYEKIIDFIITISISVTPLHVHNDAQLVLLVACAYHYQNILNFHFIIKI